MKTQKWAWFYKRKCNFLSSLYFGLVLVTLPSKFLSTCASAGTQGSVVNDEVKTSLTEAEVVPSRCGLKCIEQIWKWLLTGICLVFSMRRNGLDESLKTLHGTLAQTHGKRVQIPDVKKKTSKHLYHSKSAYNQTTLSFATLSLQNWSNMCFVWLGVCICMHISVCVGGWRGIFLMAVLSTVTKPTLWWDIKYVKSLLCTCVKVHVSVSTYRCVCVCVTCRAFLFDSLLSPNVNALF